MTNREGKTLGSKDYLSHDLEWYRHLQAALKQAVQEAYQGRWKYSLIGSKGLGTDIVEQEGVFEILKIVHDESQEELIIYAKVGEEITTAYKAHQVVHHILSDSDENYFVLVLLHSADALQFWFMTGYESHGHTGRIILRKEDNPHLQFGSLEV